LKPDFFILKDENIKISIWFDDRYNILYEIDHKSEIQIEIFINTLNCMTEIHWSIIIFWTLKEIRNSYTSPAEAEPETIDREYPVQINKMFE
jgi:hypothetical protein